MGADERLAKIDVIMAAESSFNPSDVTQLQTAQDGGVELETFSNAGNLPNFEGTNSMSLY